MFFFAALFLVGFLLTAFASPKTKIENARAATLNDLAFPRAGEGAPVPRWYGTNKFKGVNTIWAGDFKAKPIKKKVKTGLFSSKKQIIGYQYFVGMDLAVCLGPGFIFKRLWAGKYELWNGCLFDGECATVIRIDRPELFGGKDKNGGFTGDIGLFCGAYDQPQDSYLIQKIGPKVPAYVGVAHLVLRGVWFGNSPQIEPIIVEGSVFTNSLGLPDDLHIMPNGLDANPIEILHDLYTNGWGNLGIDAGQINTVQWRTVAAKVRNEGNGMSIVVSNANNGGDLTKEILRQVAATIFQNPSTGLFELKLLRNDYVIADLPVLGPSEVSRVSNFTKKLWSETSNRVRVKFTDRDQAYKDDTVAQADDFANIRFQNKIAPNEVSYPGVKVATLANELAARDLSQLNVPLYQCELIVDRTTPGLLPGSVFVFNWPEYNIESMVMRIRSFGLGTLDDGEISMQVVQDEFSADAVVNAPPAINPIPPIDYGPKLLNVGVLEMPYWLKAASGYSLAPDTFGVVFLAREPGASSLGYNVVVNDDVGEITELLSLEPYTDTAMLAADMPTFEGFATGVAASITIKNIRSLEALTVANDDELAIGRNLFTLNGELMNFRDSEDMGDGTFKLHDVQRALVDTTYTGGVANDVLFFIAGQDGYLPEDMPASVKVQDVTGAGSFPLQDCTAYALVGTGRADRPYPPDFLALDGEPRSLATTYPVGETASLAWRERNRLANPATLKFEADPSEAAEPGTVYVVKLVDEDGIVRFTSPDVAGTTFDVTFTAELEGRTTIEVWAKRDGLVSLTAALYPVLIGNTITVDDEVVEVDGEGVSIDG